MSISGKERILAAAERLFAERGFHGVSVRMVAEAASIGLGTLTHHFSSKEQLLETVVRRRSAELNGAQSLSIERVVQAGLEPLLRAFVGSYLQLIESDDDGWRSYARLIAICSTDSQWSTLLATEFEQLGGKMISRLREELPGLNEDAAVHAYSNLVSLVMGLFASNGVLDQFSHGRLSSNRIHDNVDALVSFAAGGMRALATSASQ